jgi:hypothetical protein
MVAPISLMALTDSPVAESTGRVAGSIGDVNRAASETSDASSQVLTSARVLSGEGAKFKLTVEKFLKTVRAA